MFRSLVKDLVFKKFEVEVCNFVFVCELTSFRSSVFIRSVVFNVSRAARLVEEVSWFT